MREPDVLFSVDDVGFKRLAEVVEQTDESYGRLLEEVAESRPMAKRLDELTVLSTRCAVLKIGLAALETKDPAFFLDMFASSRAGEMGGPARVVNIRSSATSLVVYDKDASPLIHALFDHRHLDAILAFRYLAALEHRTLSFSMSKDTEK